MEENSQDRGPVSSQDDIYATGLEGNQWRVEKRKRGEFQKGNH